MREWPSHYILIDHVPFAVDFMTWALWLQQQDINYRCVARTDINDRCEVSTVFLGLDHNWRGGEPLLFETMIFGGPLNGEMWRYSTWAAAEQGHAEATVQARKACAQVDAMKNVTEEK